MVAWQLVVVEIMLCRLVLVADIQYGDFGVFQIDLGRVAPFYRNRRLRKQNTASKKVVLVRATWMGDDGFEHWGEGWTAKLEGRTLNWNFYVGDGSRSLFAG